MKRLNCKEAIQKFGTIPNTKIIEDKFPHYTKGFAVINEDMGDVGYAETEEAIADGCELISQYMGHKTFFLFSSFGHYKADWTFCGALIAE